MELSHFLGLEAWMRMSLLFKALQPITEAYSVE